MILETRPPSCTAVHFVYILMDPDPIMQWWSCLSFGYICGINNIIASSINLIWFLIIGTCTWTVLFQSEMSQQAYYIWIGESCIYHNFKCLAFLAVYIYIRDNSEISQNWFNSYFSSSLRMVLGRSVYMQVSDPVVQFDHNPAKDIYILEGG
jgi:hypothetical protein